MSLLEFDCQLTYPSGFRVDACFASSGDVAALFGSSGSGKTSILSMIAGLRRPDAGSIRLAGRVLYDHAKRINLRPEARHLGYVFQDDLLFPHLNVRRNLLYGRRRRPRRARSLVLGRVVEVLELGGLLERMPYTLSGGERRRVALGRALLSEPQLLLLDEPLVGLDDPLRERVLDYVEQVLKEWRIPTLYVTHSATEVRRLATHVVRLDNGRVVAAGPPPSTL